MYKRTFLLIAALSAGISRADPKCYVGPLHREGSNLALWQCVYSEESNR